MLNERIKVPVAVQKWQAAFNAARCDYRVNGLAHGYPERSQRTKVLRGLNGHGLPRQVHDHQRKHEFLGLVGVMVADKTLKHFERQVFDVFMVSLSGHAKKYLFSAAIKVSGATFYALH